MKDKKKDGGEGGGGGRRGSRKNIVGSESQGLLQAAAGTGFIGFSAFEAGGSTASTGYDAKAAGRVPGSKMQDGSSKTQGVSSTKSAGREKNKAFKMAAGHAASRGSGQVLPPQYSGSDSYLAVVSKRLAKRDVTTKLKALAELRAMCRQVAGDTAVMPNQTGSSDGGDGSYDGMRPGEAGHTTSTGALGEMAPHWVFLYQRLTTEGDRRTREAANITLLCFMKATRRAFQPVMSSLMASWWCSQADTASEVSAAAKEAFVSVFPKAKRALVLGRCAGEVLRQIDSQLAQTPESLQEASGCSVEEAESRAERLAISAIDGLANLMETVGRETNERLCRAPQHEPTLPEEEQSVNGSNGDGDGDEQGDMTYWSVANDRLWERLVDPRPVVRRAAYGLVSACCRHAPALLLPRPLRDGSPSQPSTQNGGGIGCEAEGTETVQAEWDKGATGGLGKRKGKKRKASRVAAPSLLVQLLGEKEVANHRQAWEAVLLVMEMSKRSWTAEEGAEMVLPTVVKKLEKGAFIASAASSYPCLLPFVASLSMETLLLPSNGRIGSPGKMAREQDTMTETETRTEGETALSASGTSGASFCLDFLRAVWMPLEHPPSGLSAGHEGENGAWVAQIVSAHLECIAFLLLKLQPDPRSIATGSGSPGSESVALGQARAVRDVAREAAGILVVYARSILLTEVEEVEALHAKVGRKIRGSGAMRVVGKAFGRVMGQLHLGARRGAGMMGFPAWAEASLWGGLLETLIEALDRRSEGISAMADALVHALGYVKVGTAQGATAGSERGAVLRDGGDGLLGVCRAAFQHCASCIDGVALDGGGDGRNPWKATDVGDEKVEAVGQREVPLASLMASLSRALGLRNCLLPKSGASGTAGTASGDPAPSEDVHTDDVSRAFYRDFIVPRLTATAAAVKDGDNSARRNKGGKAESAPLDSLSDMVRVHFSESDSVGDDFSCLVLGALSQPGVERFETCSTVLRLAPEDFSGTVPCLEDALLQACGVATETGGGASPGEGSSRNGNSLPTFVKACLGTWGERRETQAFVASGVVREVIETSLEILRGGASPSSRSSSSGACGETHTIALLALDGLLGVLAADSSKSRVRRAPSSHEAIDVVKQVGVDLLLAAFREFGERGALGKLWQGNGVRALRRVMGRTGPRGESRVSDAHRDVWESFVEGAAEHTRRVMEGGEDDRDVDGDRRGDRGEHGDGDGRDVSVAGKVWRVDLVSPERASVLALELMKWEQELGFVDPIFPCAIPEKGFPYETADFVSRAAPSGDVRRETLRGHRSHASYLPALWRLGLTRAGVWQHRRREAFDGTEAKTAAELARSCLASRWARRWQCLSSICSRLQSARARLLFLMEVVSRGASAYPSEGTAGVVLHEAVAAGLFVHHAGSFLHTASVGASKDMEAVDLPPGLLIPSAMAMAVGSNKPCGDDRGRHGSTLGTGAVSRALEALGVGIACWRKAPPSQDTPTAQAADVIGAAVMDAASMHLTGIGHAKVPENSSGSNSSEMMPPGERVRDASRESWGRVEMGVKWDHVSAAAMVHPFSLLLPQDLWQASFERSSPRADEVRETVEDAPASRDTRCHEVLLAGLRSAVGAMALDAARSGDRQSEASAWWLSCAAEVTSGFMSALLGETFVLGLGLGTSASRVMASRCGAYKPATPTPADLAPGARTLYTREGQAVTVVAEHKDKGGGEPYYTVRPLDTVGHEKQTVLGRLFLSPPMESDAAQAGGDDSKSSCPWIVRYPVAVRLTEILVGTVLGVEERLWGTLRSRGVESRPDKFGLAVAAAVSLRSCASACVRSALLSASWSPSKVHGSGIAVARPTTDPTEEVVPAGGMDVWEEVGPRLIQVRDRWASVCVKSGLVLETGRVGESGEGSEADARVAVALSTSVLSAFFCGTPFLPSDEASMKFVPARLEKALTDGAEDDGSGLTTPGTPCEGVVLTAAWERARALASLVYFRDATDASCRVQLYPTPASVGGELCDDVQARMEGALLALVSMARCTGWGGGELDLALARAASGLLGVEAARVGAGRGASLALDTKAAIVSWALSKFLLSGSRIAGYGADGSGGGGAGFAGSDRAVCLEVSRLLTAVAWDGRKGWGGDGSSASRARYLVAGPEEAAEVWAEARSPTVWKGLHAAMVGAVRHPTIQVCAFEVLEAAAGGWDCGGEGSVSAEAKEDDSGSEKGPGDPEEIEREEDAQEAEGARGWTGGSSIVSRLATALGGWGLGSVARSEREVGDAQGEAGSEEGGGADDEGDGGMPSEQVREETAKEQQDDLELIARCFPEDLLLAVESLSGTIYALNDEGDSPHAQGRRRSHLSVSNAGEYSDDDVDDRDVDVSDDKLELEELEESVPQEAVEKDVGEGGILDDDVLPEDKALDESDEGEADLDVQEEDKGGDRGAQAGYGMHQPSGRSRRRRLRRRRQADYSRGSDNSVPSNSRSSKGERSFAEGPSLTGPLLTWLLWLEHCQRASECEGQARTAARAFITRAGVLGPVMEACLRVLKAPKVSGNRGIVATARLGPARQIRVSRLDTHNKPLDLARLALAVYFRTVHVFPALTRAWWADDCPRSLRVWAAEFTKMHVSPALIQIEAEIIADATTRGIWEEGGEMAVRASATSRQVVASYVKEECTLEACIQLPPEYPLRSVEVTCSRRMGVAESRWRTWVLQIVTLLSLQDGSVLDAVMLWKKNVDKEFEGVEPCVICYVILHPRDMALPRLSCKTCKNRFHSSCLYRWFHTSHKSKCPICQQQWV